MDILSLTIGIVIGAAIIWLVTHNKIQRSYEKAKAESESDRATYCCLRSWALISANPFQPRSRANAIKDCLSYG